ncbi:serine/threonine protein kinase [Desulfopila inferna]|uniref:serine/threonine protein kinase n=1 Tax=Desulfopila inferna TaxID=468528 RepID=UPI001962701B|nr:serine/threonine-protein kinase [Desulfopila inferna]MBM9606385.1 protein kinase [Desulfopila inferna]
MDEKENITFQPGKVLDGKWIIIELIGKGAMGEVYRAHQTNLKRDVAIKIISETILSEIEEDPVELEIAFARFQREVQTMAQVRHPNVLTIYDYGEVADSESGGFRTAYIVMEYIPGNSLRFTLSDDGLDDAPELFAQWIRNYFLPVLDGVEVLHTHKIVHRDLKPENIFMDGNIPKIADFGLARSYQMKAVTSSVEMLGTLAYMSPEQCSDFKTADYPTDIYALGKILFEAVHGKLTQKIVPFTSVGIDDSEGEFMAAIDGVIRKATAERPEQRYQNVQGLRNEVQEALSLFEKSGRGEAGESGATAMGRHHKWLAAGVIAAILSVSAMTVYHMLEQDDSPVSLEEQAHLGSGGTSADNQMIVSADDAQSLEAFLTGRDGSRMILTGQRDMSGANPPFYMDWQKVTNFLFVEFLNAVKEKVFVENGVVRHGDTIVNYIGRDSTAEQQIIFEHDTFHLLNQENGDTPVLRVTYHGAMMYAGHYGKELLTEDEWRFAYLYHLENPADETPQEQPGEPAGHQMMMHEPSPPQEEVVEREVLDKMGVEIKEWVRVPKDAAPDESQQEQLFSGVIDAAMINRNQEASPRYPWEGFFDVGFRTKVPVELN